MAFNAFMPSESDGGIIIDLSPTETIRPTEVAFCDGHTPNPVASGPGGEAEHAQDEVGLVVNWMGGDGAPGEDVMCQNNLKIGDDFIFVDYKPIGSLAPAPDVNDSSTNPSNGHSGDGGFADGHNDNFLIIDWLAEDHFKVDPSDPSVDPNNPNTEVDGRDFLIWQTSSNGMAKEMDWASTPLLAGTVAIDTHGSEDLPLSAIDMGGTPAQMVEYAYLLVA